MIGPPGGFERRRPPPASRLTAALGLVLVACGVGLRVLEQERFPVWALVTLVGLGALLVDPGIILRAFTAWRRGGSPR